ncbi:XRE family transcriptional regulator [Acinetobacter courvalinii]|uniref:LexA family protein n=1 Tax=Acinetobacter courvalinii TaxID=280147 RepID=UPI0021D26F76|nr:XRE family transcriptional regulator [Acinetobacter courvalinii]MCU4576104.1 XRE family transcriptional regulator [Acinetobacter courvalinii]
METLGSRLKDLRKERKLTQQQLADKVGVSKTSIIYWEKDENTPKHDSLTALAQTLGCPIDYLLSGSDKNGIAKESENVKAINPHLAPVLSWVQAGTFTNVQSVNLSQVEEWLPLPDECTNCFYLKVQGISNQPEFLEGDYILVDPDVYYNDMQSGDMIVVRRFEDATFKKLVIETDGSRYMQALNPNFQPNIIPLDEHCHFVGQVVDCIRYTYRAKRRSRPS